MTRRRCDYDGCRAWPKRGAAYCVAHSERQSQPRDDQQMQARGIYAAYVPVVDLKSALRLPAGDLRLEIAVARQVLARLLAAELPPAELVAAMDRATSALVRMLKANKQLSEDAAGELETAVEQYLAELGLGRGGA